MANRASADLVGKAIEQIDRERMVKMTMDLTNIPSPTGYEGDMARAVNELLRGAGFDSVLQPIGDERYNAVGRLQGKGGGKSLMFNGHLDTSFGPEQAHRGIGYKCEGTLVDNEWIYGMGSFNMKSAMATYITASEAIRKAGIKLGGDVVIAGVAGEIEKSPVNDYESVSGLRRRHQVRHYPRRGGGLLYPRRADQHDADFTALRHHLDQDHGARPPDSHCVVRGGAQCDQ